jgi:hypothetical protein
VPTPPHPCVIATSGGEKEKLVGGGGGSSNRSFLPGTTLPLGAPRPIGAALDPPFFIGPLGLGLLVCVCPSSPTQGGGAFRECQEETNEKLQPKRREVGSGVGDCRQRKCGKGCTSVGGGGGRGGGAEVEEKVGLPSQHGLDGRRVDGRVVHVIPARTHTTHEARVSDTAAQHTHTHTHTGRRSGGGGGTSAGRV